MRKNRLENSDLYLSEIGLGTWAMGGLGWRSSWGPQSDSDSINTIIKAAELGINWVDTAAVYGLGHSETLVGRALKELGEPLMVASKCGLVWNSSGQINKQLSRKSIQEEIDQSLKRLGLETIDLYQVHWPTSDAEIKDLPAIMEGLKTSGKIKHWGVSNFSSQQLKLIDGYLSLQSPLSLLDQAVMGYELNYVRDRGVAFLAYSPLQNGLLTDKASKSWVKSLPDTDWRPSKNKFFKGKNLEKALDINQKLKNIAAIHSTSVQGLALRWTSSQEGVSSTIIGARNPKQLEGSLLSFEKAQKNHLKGTWDGS